MKKQLIGIIISTKMDKSAKVQVVRRWTHPIYQKTISKRKNYLVHNSILKLNPGDKVIIQETKPISKKKCWEVLKKV